MKTIKDLFAEQNSFLVDIELNKDFSVYVEGLDNFGLGIFDLNYKIEDIESFCVEIIFQSEFLKNLSKHNITLNTTVEEIKQLAIEELRNGYKVITGLDSKELKDAQLLNYMKNVLQEEREV